MPTLPTLPVIDLRSPDLDALRRATHEIGFFYLTGHGVPAALPDQLLTSARDFFCLPEVNKLQIENVRSPHFRGYTRLGSEHTYGAADQREQLDIGPEARAIPVAERLHPWDVLVGPNQWPRQVPALRGLALDYLDRLTTVSLRLLEAWATSLGADPRAFSPAPGQRPQPLLKIARYPGTDLPQGVGPHKDIGTLTLLHLEEGSTGLQAETVDGAWIDVAPLPGAYVVNIGEALEIATDGYLRATPHRVLTPPPGTDRLSLPYFYNPPYEARAQRLQLPPELAAEAPGAGRDLDEAPLYEVSGLNSLKTRLRSHPNVAAAHHLELLNAELASF